MTHRECVAEVKYTVTGMSPDSPEHRGAQDPAGDASGLESRFVHHHNGYQLLYIAGGRVRVSIGGKQYEAGPGSMVVINNLEIHRVDVLEQPYKRYYAVLSPHALISEIRDKRMLYIFSNRPENFSHVIPMGGYEEKTRQIFEDMLREHQADEVLGEEWQLCCVRELLILLFRLCADTYQFSRAAYDTMWEVKRYLEDNCTQEISIAAVAEKFFASACYMAHAFKRMTGYNPKRYLLLCRLAVARELLYSTDYTVTEVAQRAGFSDINNFIRYFKREVGVTPGQFRKNIQA